MVTAFFSALFHVDRLVWFGLVWFGFGFVASKRQIYQWLNKMCTIYYCII